MINWKNGDQEVKQKISNNQTKDNAASNKKKGSEQKKQKKLAIWKKKIARYLAYCVNGGLLCSKFTLKTMIENMKNLEQNEKNELHQEISFLLHAHNKENPSEVYELGLNSVVIDP